MISLKKRPLSVLILAAVLILTSLSLLHYMPSYDFYFRVNQEWPDIIVRIRYIGSYLFRLIGLMGGIGLLCLNNQVRVFLIGFSWYCLFTLPLRHTYRSHLYFCEPIYQHYGSNFTLHTFTWLAVLTRWIIDGAFSLILIHYLSKSSVIDAFRRES